MRSVCRAIYGLGLKVNYNYFNVIVIYNCCRKISTTIIQKIFKINYKKNGYLI